MIKVSVIVPVYNTKNYLRKCLDSLIHQTLQELEIVVVDDGSTDGSTQIIQEYEKAYGNKIKAFYKKNGGQATARNLALTKVTGEYLGFLDSDDYVDLDMFESLYRKAKQENADFVGCGFQDITYKNGKEIVVNAYTGSYVCQQPKEMFFNAIVCPFISFYRMDVIRNSGAIFPEGIIFEDTAFWVNQIPFIKKNVYLPKAFGHRMIHEGSTTSFYTPERIRQIFPVLECIIDFYKCHNLYQMYQQEVEYFCSRILLCSSMERISTLRKSEERNMMIQETYDFIQKYFPNFSDNIYLQHSIKNLYIKKSKPMISKMCITMMRLRQQFLKK